MMGQEAVERDTISYSSAVSAVSACENFGLTKGDNDLEFDCSQWSQEFDLEMRMAIEHAKTERRELSAKIASVQQKLAASKEKAWRSLRLRNLASMVSRGSSQRRSAGTSGGPT